MNGKYKSLVKKIVLPLTGLALIASSTSILGGCAVVRKSCYEARYGSSWNNPNYKRPSFNSFNNYDGGPDGVNGGNSGSGGNPSGGATGGAGTGGAGGE